MSVQKIVATAVVSSVMLFGLSACVDKEKQQAEQAAQQAAIAAANEQKAKEFADKFDDAVGKEDWWQAKVQGDVLLAQYPDTAHAKRIEPLMEDIRGKANAARDQQRMAELWMYASQPEKGGNQLSASIYAKENVDVDGSGVKPVRLIFRDHPEWGKSSYLVLEAGDFECYKGCKVDVVADDKPAKKMAASRPKTDEATAMFIEDEFALWRLLKGTKQISITFPVKAGGTRTAQFEVGGLDQKKLPAWPQ